jgi:hypothetical protein
MRGDIADLVARLGTIPNFGFMPASEQLALMRKLQLPLPWWQQASEDTACAAFLPDDAEASQRPSKRRKDHSKTISEVRREAANVGHRHNPRRQALEENVMPILVRLRASGFKPGHWEHSRNGKPSSQAVADEIEEEVGKSLELQPERIPSNGQILHFIRRQRPWSETDDANAETEDAIA